MDELTNNNMLEPIVFDDPGLANQFAGRHACALCGSYLMIVHDYNAQGIVQSKVLCPKCGNCYRHTVIERAAAERVKSNELQGAREMRPTKPPRDPKTILEELGF